MPGAIRIVRGDPRVIDLPKASADSFQAGDILWWDAGNAVVKKASQGTGADHAAKSATVGTNFVGVAMADRDAGDTGDVPVATSGDWLFRVSGTPALLAGLRVTDNSGAPDNDRVESTATATQFIGRAISPAVGGKILVRIQGRMNQI